MPAHDFGAGQAVGCGLDDFELKRDGVTDPVDLEKLRERCGEHPVKVTEVVDQFSCQRFDVFPGDGPEQDKFEKFVVRNSIGAAIQEPLTQPFPVVAHVGWHGTGDWFDQLDVVIIEQRACFGKVCHCRSLY